MKTRGIRNIARKFILRIGLGLIILIAAAALAYRPLLTISAAKTSYRSASGSLAGLAQVRTLLSSLSSAERAFIATGKPGYREAYAGARAQVRREMDALKGLLRNEPAQQARVNRLNDLVRKRFGVAEQAMGRQRSAVSARGAGDEESLVREIGTLLSDLEQEENSRLQRIDSAVRRLARVVIIAVAGAGIAVLLTIIFALDFAQREIASRRRIQENVARLLQTAEQAGDLVVIADRKGRITYINKAVEETTGYGREEVVGKRRGTWFPWYSNEQFLREMRETVLAGRSFRAAATGTKKTGELFYVNEVVTPLANQAGKVTWLISTAKNITRQKELEDRLDSLDKFDPLTGLSNRRYFAELLEREIAAAKEEGRFLSVLIVNIDRFKHINDLLGPETGDEVLKRVSEKLRAAVGARDIVARLGSDEFAVVHFDDSQPVDAAAVAENLRSIVLQNISVGTQDIVVTVTIGISVFPAHGNDARTLLKNADLALAKAKTQGRNLTQLFDEDITREVSAFFFLQKRLFHALKNDEYLVHYQPYCDLATRNVSGAEALIKWKNSELGMVSPAEFIPSLEETGMIIDVGRWVLETACSQIKEWEMKNRIFPVSVNLSFIQFRHKYLVGMVADAVRDFKLDPRHLTLEVTESVFMHDMEFAIKTLKLLKSVGVSISIDDFGTGYSSLSYLKRLPVDNVKIDISFVRDVTSDQDAASIITAITTLARGLNLKTIAEGVETEEQRNILHLLRCDMGQGFYFSPAVPAAEFEHFLARARLPQPGI